jgi:hypothetical protein
MSSLTRFLWRALTALGESDPTLGRWAQSAAEEAARSRRCRVDLSDPASVRAAFHVIVEREWGDPHSGRRAS